MKAVRPTRGLEGEDITLDCISRSISGVEPIGSGGHAPTEEPTGIGPHMPMRGEAGADRNQEELKRTVVVRRIAKGTAQDRRGLQRTQTAQD